MQDEFEIDFRPFIHALLKNWYWMLGSAILCAGIVLGYQKAFVKPVYESSAMIMITNEKYTYNFDSKILTQDSQPNKNVLPQMATSDEILKALYSQWQNKLSGYNSPDDLRKAIKATKGTDASVVILSVTLPEPEAASTLANLWAGIFVNRVREIYGETSVAQVNNFAYQMEQSKSQLQKAEQALTDFEAKNYLNIQTNQLNSALQSQSDYLGRKRNIQYILQDLQTYKGQLGKQTSTSQLSQVDQLSFIYLQSRIYNLQFQTPQAYTSQTQNQQPSGGGSEPYTSQSVIINANPGSSASYSPVQVQLPVSSTENQPTVSVQINLVDSTISSLQEQNKMIEAALSDVDKEILDLQTKVQASSTMEKQLQQDRDTAQETYLTLSRKAAETNISAQGNNSAVQLAASAITPEMPSDGNTRRNVLIAAVAGLILSGLVIVAREWIRILSREIATAEHI